MITVTLTAIVLAYFTAVTVALAASVAEVGFAG